MQTVSNFGAVSRYSGAVTTAVEGCALEDRVRLLRGVAVEAWRKEAVGACPVH